MFNCLCPVCGGGGVGGVWGGVWGAVCVGGLGCMWAVCAELCLARPCCMHNRSVLEVIT
jgi:hypothetical protein